MPYTADGSPKKSPNNWNPENHHIPNLHDFWGSLSRPTHPEKKAVWTAYFPEPKLWNPQKFKAGYRHWLSKYNFPGCTWVFPKILVPPKIIHFNRVFPYFKPSILGVESPYIWKRPYSQLQNHFHPQIIFWTMQQHLPYGCSPYPASKSPGG